MLSANWTLYASPSECSARLEAFGARHNEIRPHWALELIEGGDLVTPADAHCRGVAVQIPAWQTWAQESKERLHQLLAKDAQAA